MIIIYVMKKKEALLNRWAKRRLIIKNRQLEEANLNRWAKRRLIIKNRQKI